MTARPATSRTSIVTAADRIVVKLGTRVVCHDDGTLNTERVAAIAEEVATLIDGGRRIVIVSSGAVGAGMSQLGLQQRPQDLAALQAVAAVGQARLIDEYQHQFDQHRLQSAQVLLTSEDLDDRARYLNVRNTLLKLLEMGAVPIINENDTVAVDELLTTFGDNDRLAARVTNLLGAPLLVILSDVAGLLRWSAGSTTSQLRARLTQIDQSIWATVRDAAGNLSRGGMASKLKAADELTRSGEHVIVASGHQAGALSAIMQGEPLGTCSAPTPNRSVRLKRWIGFSAKPKGTVELDQGPARAIVGRRAAVCWRLASVSVNGSFRKGDVISLVDESARRAGPRRHQLRCPRSASDHGSPQPEDRRTVGALSLRRADPS